MDSLMSKGGVWGTLTYLLFASPSYLDSCSKNACKKGEGMAGAHKKLLWQRSHMRVPTCISFTHSYPIASLCVRLGLDAFLMFFLHGY